MVFLRLGVELFYVNDKMAQVVNPSPKIRETALKFAARFKSIAKQSIHEREAFVRL